MRSALEKEADLALHLMSALSSFPGRPSGDLLAQVMFRFAEGSDRSVFGLMNAATSLARDQADPELRWRLEKFGGDIPAMVRRLPTRDGSAARTVLV